MTRPDAIMFASDMSQLEVLMGGGKRKGRNQMVLDNVEHFHYLTNDGHGEVILRLLCDPELKASLDGILMEDLTPAAEISSNIDCDAFDGDGAPVLFGYTCDMPRIKRFDGGLSIPGIKGTLFCFDFQADALSRACDSQVRIECIDFDAVNRLIIQTCNV